MAYRAEDISKRLVPHELYIREELEESVQFDVRPVSVVLRVRLNHSHDFALCGHLPGI